MEFAIAWILLFIAFFSGEANWYIASGMFAIAGNINALRKENERENRNNQDQG